MKSINTNINVVVHDIRAKENREDQYKWGEDQEGAAPYPHKSFPWFMCVSTLCGSIWRLNMAAGVLHQGLAIHCMRSSDKARNLGWSLLMTASPSTLCLSIPEHWPSPYPNNPSHEHSAINFSRLAVDKIRILVQILITTFLQHKNCQLLKTTTSL